MTFKQPWMLIQPWMGIYWELHDENGDIPWEYNGRNIANQKKGLPLGIIKHGGHAELPEFNVCIKTLWIQVPS